MEEVLFREGLQTAMTPQAMREEQQAVRHAKRVARRKNAGMIFGAKLDGLATCNMAGSGRMRNLAL
jgi:hypothetical protein